ncbi:hypothetical protein HLRTI_003028 [Halorhabdus tiamatea SARL4B]|uniref:Uncharacterized protein n=1 Tax=Halorhabdus tiamatea SARL4B TaxID=1033806 RepID=U2DXQ2_9EURY|nr:hypothetical protein HLRTI_003028 [Halorhabdus tiamatea SARL4B]
MERRYPGWIPIALISVVSIVFGFIGSVTVPDTIVSTIIFFPFLSVLIVLLLASPRFVAQEREQLSESGPWYPSRWYYLIPVVPLLTFIYIIQRYRYIGLR